MPQTVGLITYHYPHLKTEQVLQRLLGRGFDLRIYALPYSPRKPRATLYSHRPDQTLGIAPQVMAGKHRIPYVRCSGDRDIDGQCDIYLVLGASLLSPACVDGKRIVNSHPGIIPASRGLDSFKWALHEGKPLGITLHFIDAAVDAGEVISIVPTNVYGSDTFESLARRHYENEIDCLSRFDQFMAAPVNPFAGIAEGQARMRMPLATERELAARFEGYRERFGA